MAALSGWSWELDGWIVAAGVLCAVAATLLGNFLVLRKMSMLGDAITHAVLPGLAVAFFISESRSSVPMFLGAVVVGTADGDVHRMDSRGRQGRRRGIDGGRVHFAVRAGPGDDRAGGRSCGPRSGLRACTERLS